MKNNAQIVWCLECGDILPMVMSKSDRNKYCSDCGSLLKRENFAIVNGKLEMVKE